METFVMILVITFSQPAVVDNNVVTRVEIAQRPVYTTEQQCVDAMLETNVNGFARSLLAKYNDLISSAHYYCSNESD